MKNQKRKLVRVLFILALGLLATLNVIHNLHAKKIASDDLSNMIIEGESRLKVKPQIPELAWNVNPYENVGDLMKENNVITEFKAPAVNHPPLSLPEKSLSDKTASPWLSRFYEPPLITLKTRATAQQTAKQEWAFLIKDSKGKIFYEQKGRGLLPEELEWAGFGDNREPIHVGYDYTYTLSLQDEGGNPQRFSGKPFRVPAFRYESGKLVMMLDPNALFEDAASTQLTEEGLKLLTEVKDAIRTRSGDRVEILSYVEDAKFGETRGLAIKKVLMKVLDLESSLITVSSQHPSKGGGYSHVDITVR